MGNLRERFAERIEETNRECRESCYPPTGFEQMLENKHAVELAKELVMSGKFHTGLKRLIREGRPDLTLEHVMLGPEFSQLFSTEELKTAQWRLDNALKFGD